MSDPFRLDGKVALVTGANTGIGQAIALAMAGAGAEVIAAGRSSLDETLDLIAGKGLKARPLALALDDDHVIGPGLEQPLDTPEHRSIQREHLETHEIGPVVLALGKLGQGRSLNPDLCANPRLRGVPVSDVRKRGDEPFAVHATARPGHLHFPTPMGHEPGLVPGQRIRRVGVGAQLELPLHTEHADDFAQQDAIRRRIHRRVSGWRGTGGAISAPAPI